MKSCTGLAVLFALAVVLLVGVGDGVAAEAVVITAAEAGDHLGEYATVCGDVASTAYIARSSSQPTFLNLDRPHPNQLFTVVIWGSDRRKFDGPPDELFADQSICVTGTIAEFKGTPQIVVTDPTQITVEETVAERHARLTYEETILLKSVLAHLGYELDFGTGSWDDATERAVLEFQDDRGLDHDATVGAETLRALADAVNELAPEDQALILRHLLFSVARREESGFGG